MFCPREYVPYRYVPTSLTQRLAHRFEIHLRVLVGLDSLVSLFEIYQLITVEVLIRRDFDSRVIYRTLEYRADLRGHGCILRNRAVPYYFGGLRIRVLFGDLHEFALRGRFGLLILHPVDDTERGQAIRAVGIRGLRDELLAFIGSLAIELDRVYRATADD